jgi:hypothetical protein
MAITLYDATVASYLQTLGAISGVLDKGLAHCTENKVDPQTFVDTRLAPDMLPLTFQIASVAHHSLGAVKAAQDGVFRPPTMDGLSDYASLQTRIAQARDELGKLTPADVNALEGRDVVFELGQMKMPFVAQDFLFSFSLPNFYFHATTTYDILRHKGVKLGKRDFMGALRMKR